MEIGTLSGAARASLFALNDVSEDLRKHQLRLSSGKRINGPLDNPSAFYTASSLSTRASSLNDLLDGIGTATSTITAAMKGIDAVRKTLDSLQALANQALQTAAATASPVVGARTNLNSNTSLVNGGDATHFKAGDTVTVSDGTTSSTYTAQSGDTTQTFLNFVNGAGLKVTASLSGGAIQFQPNGSGTLTFGASLQQSNSALSTVLGFNIGSTAFSSTNTRQSLAQQYNALRSQIESTMQDASFQGINLLTSGSLVVSFNETGTSKLAIQGQNLSASALGVGATLNTWQSDADVNVALANITNAKATLDAQSAVLTANLEIVTTRQSFAKDMIQTLTSGANALVEADPNEESAIVLALQSRQQLALTALSLVSNGSPLMRMLAG